MRKLLTILGAVGLTATSAATVVACGEKGNSEVGKETDIAKMPVIAKLIKENNLKISGDASITVDTAYTNFLNLTGIKTVLKITKLNKESFDLEIVKPDKEHVASLKITVKGGDGVKYSGTINVTISDFKLQLGDILTTEAEQVVQGTADMHSADDALQAFLNAGGQKLDASQVRVREGSYRPAQPGVEGSFTLEAIDNSTKYSGDVPIVIKGLPAVALDSVVKQVNRNVVSTSTITDGASALTAFLATPAGKGLDSNEVEFKKNSFIAVQPNANGSFVIKAKNDATKYTGEIIIIISPTRLSDINLMITTKTIVGSDGMSQEEAIDALSKTLSWSNLNDFVTVKSFEAPNSSEQKAGQLVLEARNDTAYIGSVTITINY